MSRGLRLAGVMTSAAQMSSNISILIGPCLIRNVDDYWHNIFTRKGTAELCFSTYMLKNTGSKCANAQHEFFVVVRNEWTVKALLILPFFWDLIMRKCYICHRNV